MVSEQAVVGTQLSSSISIDHLHPLYLHPSDAPGSLNVGIMLTGTDNYTLWSKAMQLALLGKNKLGFIDGSADLKERFNKVNNSRIFQLYKEIFTLVQGVSSISVYYSKLEDLWDKYDSIMPPPLRNCPKSREFYDHLQYQRMLQFLMGLNDNYSQARSQILLIPQLPNVNQAYALVNQDESQKLVAGSKTEKPYAPNAVCDYCHIKGHLRSDCNKLLKCEHCHKTGHLMVNCFRLIGYPPDYKGKREVVVAGNFIYDTGSVNLSNYGNPPIYGMMPMSMLTPRQHQQLLRMLEKTSIAEITGSANTSIVETTGSANIAGGHGFFLMRLKSDVSSLLKYFFTEVETQFGKKIQRVRLDNGFEFFNSTCNELFKSHGVIHESSCPHTPQRNGVVEKKHRHILETAREIKFQAGFPDKFWGCCVQAVVYILNRVPSTVLGNVSPFEELYNKPPSFDHMRVIGCLCFATNLMKQDKFSPRAIKATERI
ncbi:uncharacterized protein [Solanum lycopersicum]|uniref:uncharacterized protein n=1 Tax=Solanum lycopersicum TaxID=4081 RepID=UPI003748278C